jgi:hypothetical protein
VKTFVIEQGYNCLNWRTVHVRAETVEEAVAVAYEAEGSYFGEEPEDDDPIRECTDWCSDGGGGECGPTFTLGVAEGDEIENVHAATDEQLRPIPVAYRQFATEHSETLNTIRTALAFLQSGDALQAAAQLRHALDAEGVQA